jgi:hypothetical protein
MDGFPGYRVGRFGRGHPACPYRRRRPGAGGHRADRARPGGRGARAMRPELERRGATPMAGRAGLGERTSYMPGTFLLGWPSASDPPEATGFYTGLFGWQSEELSAAGAGTYAMLRRVGKDVAILYPQTAQARAPACGRTGLPTSRSRTPTRPPRERTSSVAPRSSASPSMRSTTACLFARRTRLPWTTSRHLARRTQCCRFA